MCARALWGTEHRVTSLPDRRFLECVDEGVISACVAVGCVLHRGLCTAYRLLLMNCAPVSRIPCASSMHVHCHKPCTALSRLAEPMLIGEGE